jgi:hypothetical protein
MDESEWCRPQFAPDERIESRITVAIGVAVIDGEREITIHGEVTFGTRTGSPGDDYTDFVACRGKPLAIVFDCQSDAVKDRREAVIEKSIEIGACFRSHKTIVESEFLPDRKMKTE